MAKAKQQLPAPAAEETRQIATVNTHCGTVVMTKEKGYTAGPTVRQGDTYEVIPFGADNGYVAIEIPATDTEDAYHVWIDRDCVDIPEE